MSAYTRLNECQLGYGSHFRVVCSLSWWPIFHRPITGPINNPGINQRALALLFEEAADRSKDWSYSIQVSVIEIYNESVRDLLSATCSDKLDIKLNQEGHLYVPGMPSARAKWGYFCVLSHFLPIANSKYLSIFHSSRTRNTKTYFRKILDGCIVDRR